MSRRRRMDMAELLGEEEGGGTELNLTPYLDIITTLVIFMIFTFQVVIEFRLIDVFVPAYGHDTHTAEPDPDKPHITVQLIVTDDGFRVLASSGILPSEVPKKDGKYDYDGLHETLVTWKEKLDLDTTIIMMASDDVQYETVVETMDAIRYDGKKLLFPDVALATASSGGAN